MWLVPDLLERRSYDPPRLAGFAVGVLAAIALAGCNDDDPVPDDDAKLAPELLEGIAEAWLLDDFDDGDGINEAGGNWVIYDDALDGGESVTVPPSWDEAPFSSDAPGYDGGGFAAHLQGTTASALGYDYVGFDTALHPGAFCPDSTPTELDLNAYDGVQFMAKGTASAGSLVFKIPHLADGPEACGDLVVPESLTDWADYRKLFNAELSKNWSLIRIRWRDLLQPSWATTSPPLSEVLAHAKVFTWEFTGPSGEVDLWLDSVALFKDLPPEPLDGLLVDDFEDGDHLSLLEGPWDVDNDAKDGGLSTFTIAEDAEGELAMDGEGHESERSFYVEYSLDQGDWAYEPYVYWTVALASESKPFDANEYEGFSYWFKGNSHAVQVLTQDVVDYDFYRIAVRGSEDWTRVDVPFRDLNQKGFGEVVPLRLNNVQSIGWVIEGTTGDTGEVWIDDLMLVDSFPALEDEPPDREVLDPEPPDDEIIDAIEIANPLQALAMETLNRGYNITNWLEEGPFEDFGAYDEQFVANVAAAGFESLRLPIDLDQYIVDRDAFFTGEATFAIDPELFTILDSFEAWTATNGLSLTIDYHQYDGSLDLEDPLGVEAMLGLWAGIAEHYADNPREDLFFELLNEPELSGDGSEVAPETWTLVAEQAITAIRENDPDRVLLFGDVQWNAIDPLVDRTPFSDSRIIYVFHFYEPFLFTHQGSSWNGMETIHDIPYPYDPDRWSEYSRDLGLHSPQIPAWVLAAAETYYRDGNKAAIRNQIVEAKRWAVENDVPVICNEFGAYDRTSQLEDRANYLADLTDIFAELEIPWQHWFMIMDAESGEVDPDLAAALGLSN